MVTLRASFDGGPDGVGRRSAASTAALVSSKGASVAGDPCPDVARQVGGRQRAVTGFARFGGVRRRDARMEFRSVGGSGLRVSVAGLGCNNFGGRIDEQATQAVVSAALDAGITLFDTADSYGQSEDFLGEVLEGRRDDVILATKFGSDVRGGNGKDFQARGSQPW